jgi:short-subunit dehydrogenase involved in D-alanine esterification of teichoic acids
MIIHNAGIQRGVNFHEPATVDIPTMTAELATNYTSIIYLLKYALPHLLAKTSGRRKNTAIVFVTSQLGVFPMVRCGNYSASKAAAHQLIYTLREQLEATNVNIIEVLPPAVQSELARYQSVHSHC